MAFGAVGYMDGLPGPRQASKPVFPGFCYHLLVVFYAGRATATTRREKQEQNNKI